MYFSYLLIKETATYSPWNMFVHSWNGLPPISIWHLSPSNIIHIYGRYAWKCECISYFDIIIFGSLRLPPAYLRLVLWIVMGMPPGSIVTLGCDCSSWTVPARGTSMRNFLNPYGNVFLEWVRKSNCMVSRNLVWEVKWHICTCL